MSTEPPARDSALTILGLMSGTSVDGIDTAAVRFRRDLSDPTLLHAQLLRTSEHAWSEQDRAQLLDAMPPGELDAAALSELHARCGAAFGRAAAVELQQLSADGVRVDLVASHGQTLFHGAGPDGTVTSTLQIGDPARIHAVTGTPVLADLRTADVAAGGQGAPLVPLLDSLLVAGRTDLPGRTALLNIGGIGNVTVLEDDGTIRAIGDTGPGNALLDAAVRTATGQPCDRDAARARTGTVDPGLLAALREDPFYALPLPRSTGREHFTPGYVAAVAARSGIALPDLPDLLATLVELTASTIADVLAPHRPGRVLLSGGGAHNPLLCERLAGLLPDTVWDTTARLGLDADAKEAVLVALIGWMSIQGLPGVPFGRDGRPATGARGAQVLGVLTPPVGAPRPDGAGPITRLRLTSSASAQES